MAFLIHIEDCRKAVEKLKLFKKNDIRFELALVGSILPDLEIIGIVNGIHGNSYNFYEYLRKKDKKYAPIGIGMMAHELFDHVYDEDYVHPKEPIAEKLIERFDRNSLKVKRSAEALIDHSTDAYYLQRNPQLMKCILNVKQKLKDRHKKKIAYHIATYFNGDYKKILKALKTFEKFDIQKYQTTEGLSEMWMNFMFLRANKDLISTKSKLDLFNGSSTLKLGWKYLIFRLKTKKSDIKKMFEHIKEHLAEHKQVCQKAHKHVQEQLRKRLFKHQKVYKGMKSYS